MKSVTVYVYNDAEDDYSSDKYDWLIGLLIPSALWSTLPMLCCLGS